MERSLIIAEDMFISQFQHVGMQYVLSHSILGKTRISVVPHQVTNCSTDWTERLLARLISTIDLFIAHLYPPPSNDYDWTDSRIICLACNLTWEDGDKDRGVRPLSPGRKPLWKISFERPKGNWDDIQKKKVQSVSFFSPCWWEDYRWAP